MSNIILPQQSRMEGFYEIEVRHNGKLVRHLPRFRNLITDRGLAMWRSNYVDVPRVALGSSNTPPLATDTALGAQVGNAIAFSGGSGMHSSSYNRTVLPYYTEVTWKVVFPMNTIVGNLAEIGVDMNYSSSNPAVKGLFSRSLLKDSGGSPTIITVLPMEEVTVYYTLRIYDNLEDTTGTFKLGTETYDYTSYACTSPQYVGVRSGFAAHRGVSASAASNNGFSARGEAVVPADVRQSTSQGNTVNLGFPQTSPNNGQSSGIEHMATLNYNQNIAGNADIASIYLDTYSCNPRRIVFDPPIPKDPTRKITFKLFFDGGIYTP